MGGFLVLVGLGGIVFGVINLVLPLGRLRIETRGQAGLVVAGSFVVMLIGGAIVAPEDSGVLVDSAPTTVPAAPPASTAAPPVSATASTSSTLSTTTVTDPPDTTTSTTEAVESCLRDGNSMLINASCIEQQWPLSVDEGILICDSDSVTFIAEGITYTVNGLAMTRELGVDIEPIWKDNPEIEGFKISIGPLIDLGLSLCT